eukprot:scaffold7545_cov42-Phaeocystis_antarctica.AAC.3
MLPAPAHNLRRALSCLVGVAPSRRSMPNSTMPDRRCRIDDAGSTMPPTAPAVAAVVSLATAAEAACESLCVTEER